MIFSQFKVLSSSIFFIFHEKNNIFMRKILGKRVLGMMPWVKNFDFFDHLHVNLEFFFYVAIYMYKNTRLFPFLHVMKKAGKLETPKPDQD